MKKLDAKKALIPPIPLYPEGCYLAGSTMAPLGSYSGIPDDPAEKPVQDADDL